MKQKKIIIKKIDQNYLKNLLLLNEKISSGRKNYDNHYNRILKNVLLSKLFSNEIMPFKNNFKIIINKSYVAIISNNIK